MIGRQAAFASGYWPCIKEDIFQIPRSHRLSACEAAGWHIVGQEFQAAKTRTLRHCKLSPESHVRCAPGRPGWHEQQCTFRCSLALQLAVEVAS